ncbi:MAG: hypothetical protein ACR2LT_00610, partial [Pyrinomonadaceae bacterium]
QSPIYRAIKSNRWKENKSSAFLLRRQVADGKPEEELSVITKADCTKDVCFAKQNTCFGEFKLLVEDVRELGLDVVSRELDDNPYHAAIINLPLYTEENIKEAERIAGLLAKKVLSVQLRPK